jgi:glycosyltransferase involved in cell wall biosynthesis
MKIFGLINKNSGPGFHRIMMPLLLMPDVDAYITNAVQESDFEQRRPDAIYYNRIVSDEVLRLQSKYHFRVIVDVDDWWHLDPHHIMFRWSKENNAPAHAVKHLQIADVVTTTHERLAEEVSKYNKNVVIVPNAIPDHPYFPVVKTQSANGHKRVFWQGSVTHEADVKMLRNTIRKLDKDKYMMVMCGYTQQVEWERMADYYTDNLRMPGVVLPGADPREYYRNYQYADVCVVPLLSTKFNKYKSNLKILEAAHSGLPVIASNVHPYKNIDGVMYVNKEDDWARWLSDSDAWDDHARKLQLHCQQHYNFDEINLKRKEAFV